MRKWLASSLVTASFVFGPPLPADAGQSDPAEPIPELAPGRSGAGAPDIAPPAQEEDSEAAAPGDLEALTVPAQPPAGAADGKPASAEAAARYRDCMALADEDPRSAVDLAFAWQSADGGLAAKHCAAVAFIRLERYALGAERLAEIARDLRTGRDLPAGLAIGSRSRLLAGLYVQIGNARLMAGEAEEAYAAFSSGLAALGEGAAQAMRADLLIDRARALAAQDDFAGALADLEAAREIAPERPEIALYRASAHRALGQLDAALEAIGEAVAAGGESAAILLERGNIRRLRNEPAAARRDWEAVLERWPESAAARAAEANLAALEEEQAANAAR